MPRLYVNNVKQAVVQSDHSIPAELRNPSGAPDIVFVEHIKEYKERDLWKEAEFLIGVTWSSPEKWKIGEKFRQWLMYAWNVFEHQPLRMRLYGLVQVKSMAYLCCADHASVLFSEGLNVAEISNRSTLSRYISWFIQSDRQARGQNSVHNGDVISIGGRGFRPSSRIIRCPKLVGRGLYVCSLDDVADPTRLYAGKFLFEEYLPPKDGEFDSEITVLEQLEHHDVLNRPIVHFTFLGKPTEVWDRRKSGNPIELKSQTERAGSVRKETPEEKGRPGKRHEEDECPDPTDEELVRRRFIAIVMDQYQSAHDTVRSDIHEDPQQLVMHIVYDAMQCYLDAYNKAGWLHGGTFLEMDNIAVLNQTIDISASNIMCAPSETQKYPTGILIDWGYAYPSAGTSTKRHVRSGTLAFMSPRLLMSTSVGRRTLLDDLHSFFQTILLLLCLALNKEKWKVTDIGRQHQEDARQLIKDLERQYSDEKNFRKSIDELVVPRRHRGALLAMLQELRKILWDSFLWSCYYDSNFWNEVEKEREGEPPENFDENNGESHKAKFEQFVSIIQDFIRGRVGAAAI